MIFLTVGTSFPFDRLVRAVDQAVEKGLITQEVFAQVGVNGYMPRNFRAVETLEKREYDAWMMKADAVIAHAGMGTIAVACELQKPILVMPRRKCYRELVNDHQLETAQLFESMGHVLAVYDIRELPKKIEQLKSFVPVPRKGQARQLAERIGLFFTDIM